MNAGPSGSLDPCNEGPNAIASGTHAESKNVRPGVLWAPIVTERTTRRAQKQNVRKTARRQSRPHLLAGTFHPILHTARGSLRIRLHLAALGEGWRGTLERVIQTVSPGEAPISEAGAPGPQAAVAYRQR